MLERACRVIEGLGGAAVGPVQRQVACPTMG